MSSDTAVVAEFDQEMASTRRLLERVPSAHMEWKPHPRSFPLGHLAHLIARMPSWITNVLHETGLDLAVGPHYTFESPAELLAEFDRNVRAAREALVSADEELHAELWTLRMRERVLFSASRGVMVRQHISHLVHHRGQLTVYLRLRDVPLPMIYGPTADERSF